MSKLEIEEWYVTNTKKENEYFLSPVDFTIYRLNTFSMRIDTLEILSHSHMWKEKNYCSRSVLKDCSPITLEEAEKITKQTLEKR